MKLISCYIENFGAIKKKDIFFDNALTTICEENGYGKTTLAAFLEAMFFGMESDRTNSKEFPTRRHFNPFDGGHYGGNVVFLFCNDIYKIERYFDEKSENKDSITLYKNDEKIDIFNNEKISAIGFQIGEKIFGIDKVSFERTIFVNSHEIEICSTGSINAKLNNFVEGTTDDANTEKAIEQLEKKAKEYKKTRTGNDFITKENVCIIELNRRIDNIEGVKAALPSKYEKLAVNGEKLKELRQQLDNIQKSEIELKDWEHYDELINNADLEKQVIDAIDKKYPYGIPLVDELDLINKAISAKETLQKQTDKFLSKNDEINFISLNKKYSEKVPSEQEFADINKRINSLQEIKLSIYSEGNIKATEYEKNLRNRFTNNIPTVKTFENIDEATQKYNKTEKLYEDTPDFIIEQGKQFSEKQELNKKTVLLMLIISSIIAIAGIGIMFISFLPGVIMLVSGIVCLMVTGFIYLNKKTTNAVSLSEARQRVNPEKTAIEREKKNAELKIYQIVSQYGYSSEKNVLYAAEKLKNDFCEYEKLLDEDKKREEKIKKQKEKADSLSKELQTYFERYGFYGNEFSDMLSALQKEVSNYTVWITTKKKLDEQNSNTKKSIDSYENVLSKFCEKYHFNFSTLAENIYTIKKDAISYQQTIVNYKKSLQKINEFKKTKELKNRPVLPMASNVDDIKSAIQQFNSERVSLEQEIADNEKEAENLNDLYSERQRHIELLEDYKNTYNMLILTSDFLKRADKQLKDKYVKPIKDNFIKYANLFEQALGEKVTMTPNFELLYERNGVERSEKHLSAGQRSLCSFCFRMALIDNMYADEKPFLILDDPFVNLDKKHLERVKDILHNISKKMQIIYFTCHESRTV